MESLPLIHTHTHTTKLVKMETGPSPGGGLPGASRTVPTAPTLRETIEAARAARLAAYKGPALLDHIQQAGFSRSLRNSASRGLMANITGAGLNRRAKCVLLAGNGMALVNLIAKFTQTKKGYQIQVRGYSLYSESHAAGGPGGSSGALAMMSAIQDYDNDFVPMTSVYDQQDDTESAVTSTPRFVSIAMTRPSRPEIIAGSMPSSSKSKLQTPTVAPSEMAPAPATVPSSSSSSIQRNAPLMEPESAEDSDYAVYKSLLLYEDSKLMAALKPPGLAVFPADGHKSMIGLGKNYLKMKYERRAEPYVSCSHHVDTAGTGITLLTKSPAATAHVAHQLLDRQQGKNVFVCMVRGKVPMNSTGRKYVVRHYLEYPEDRAISSFNDIKKAPYYYKGSNTSRDDNYDTEPIGLSERVLAFDSEQSMDGRTVRRRKSILGFRPLSYHQIGNEIHTLIKVEHSSGRKQAIRAQFAHLGFPIVGDILYGGQKQPYDQFGDLERDFKSSSHQAQSKPPGVSIALHGLQFSIPYPLNTEDDRRWVSFDFCSEFSFISYLTTL
jgi:23S rRNA pseudouridine1911/1915/1917 synthase